MPQFQLSSDLLVRICAHIKPQPPSITYQTNAPPDEIRNEAFHSEYIDFHRIRMVCKQFKEAFDKDFHNSSHLLLHHRFSSQSLLGLLDWLQKNKLAVRSFEANCGEPHLDELESSSQAAMGEPPLLGELGLILFVGLKVFEPCLLLHEDFVS